MEILALRPQEIAALVPTENGPSPSRAKAIWQWLSQGLPTAWPETLEGAGKEAIAALKAQTRLPEVKILEHLVSQDGTMKWRLAFGARQVETVLIPTETRATVCVSSQSGCTRWCDFCATARVGFGGQLTAGEIIAQVLIAIEASAQPVTNIVYMGMGEPLDNYDAVLQSLRILEEGLLFAPRHCTVSTSGVLPRLQRLWEESQASVAISLHATTQALRDTLMPRVQRWSLESLCDWMREATEADTKRHFFIEYTLMAGVNDSLEDAQRLAELLRGIRVRINLIPFNPTPTIPYERPSDAQISAFHSAMIDAGYLTLVRRPRGEDAKAACGQLALEA